MPVEDESPNWLMDFVHWRLALNGDKKQRPKGMPKRVPESAWEVAAQVDRIANLMGPQEAFLDWAEWRRFGAKKADRPRSAPATIPKSWWQALERLELIFKGVQTAKRQPPKPKATPKPKPAAPADDGVVTPQSTLIASARATREDTRAVPALAPARHLQRRRRPRHPAHVHGDLQDRPGSTRCSSSARWCSRPGNLMSFWSQPPRRNPAGIGVTGKPGAGVSFSNWEKAARAHVGRLLAYALPKDDGTEAQRKLIDEALKVRPLPDDRRGRAPTLKGLAGSWATDRKYADKITGIANEIRQRA